MERDNSNRESSPHAWHGRDAALVLRELDAPAESGLSSTQADERRQHYGFNILNTRKGVGPLVRLLLQFHQPLIYILIAAGLITASLQEWVDSSVIFAVVVLNAVVGYLQEAKALRALDALSKTMMAPCTVVRDGEARRIDSQLVVPGDIVLLQSGDKVPADLRLIHSRDLHIDESALTGESLPVSKNVEPLDEQTPLADRRNMAYASTLVTTGQGKGVVTATGDQTEVGRISTLIAQTDELKTPLTTKIAAFSRLLLIVILLTAGLTFVIGIIRGESAVDMFMAAVALAVSAIPEGLPAAMTVILAIGVARMASRCAIIRKLPAIETLGATTVICSDKTGTLTQNQMTVREVYDGHAPYAVTGIGYDPTRGELHREDQPLSDTPPASLVECLTCGLLCNDALLLQDNDAWTIQGDPTEAALIVAAHKLGITHEAANEQYERLDAIPFESEHQYMATLHRGTGPEDRVVYLKGAVEVILQRCEGIWSADGEGLPLDHDAVLRRVEELAGKGLRVLAFARKTPPTHTNELDHADVRQGLAFLGLQAMIDPPRAEAIESVALCKQAGITVKMITGDHAVTAQAIAREIGIIDTDRAADQRPKSTALTGKQLQNLSETELVEAANRCHVFARVSPEQKLRLVTALQATGNIVAMTGDGVNDAPALKQANIGVAMGISGTEVAKESADMILTDDNFATIQAAVEEGRAVFDNLTKFIVWTLPTNAGQGLVILTAVALGLALPLLPVHILWINMATAILLGMMLAFEPREADTMLRPPRNPAKPLLDFDLTMRIGLVGLLMLSGAFGLFFWEQRSGAPIDAARTVAVNAFVVIQTFYLFNCRSLAHSMFHVGVFSNRPLLVGVLLMLLVQQVFTYAPFMNHYLHTAPISLDSWARIVCVGAAVYLIVGFEKWVRRRVGNL